MRGHLHRPAIPLSRAPHPSANGFRARGVNQTRGSPALIDHLKRLGSPDPGRTRNLEPVRARNLGPMASEEDLKRGEIRQ